MLTEMGQMIVITGECLFGSGIHSAHVIHRNLPEVCGQGATTLEAAKDLVGKLIRESSSVVGWHLTDLEQVIADVRVFLDPIAKPPLSLDPIS
jgi:hypothetical protein